MKTASPPPDLELAFDVGHSSIGWAVIRSVAADVRRLKLVPAQQSESLVTSAATRVELLGCGGVTFPANDCLAIDRRSKRRQRRNIRSRKQRIERMELLLETMGITGIREQHKQGKGNKQGEGKGFSYPWLSAARLLAARTTEEKQSALLNWNELWDVLRWYAHNRGYDGNLRWSGNYVVDGYSPENKLEADVLGEMAKKAKAQEEAEDGNSANESKGKKEDKEKDSDKLAMGQTLISLYGIRTPTFAESVAKFLLGPPRVVKPPKQPGEAGDLVKSNDTFTEESFREKLFGLAAEFKDHPKHLQNYFKGLKAAFVRRYFDETSGKRILAGGTEWEVRTIIRAHFNAPNGKACCDELFEQVICGAMPENADDWKAFIKRFPNLYVSEADKAKLQKLRGTKADTEETQKQKKAERKKITAGKITLPKRYQGGLLFGQLVPRFENRIISECPVTYARKLPMLLRVIAGDPACKDQDIWPVENQEKPINRNKKRTDKQKQIEHEIEHFKRKLAKLPANATDEDKTRLAKAFTADLAKTPGKNSLAFLEFRWAMLLANIKLHKPGEILPKGENLRPLTAQERQKIDAEVRKRGFLDYQRQECDKKTAKITKKEVNELADILKQITGCEIADTNLDGFFIPPDMREALKLVPVESKGSDEFQLVWPHLDDKLRHRFTIQMLEGRVLTAELVCAQLRKLPQNPPAGATDKSPHKIAGEIESHVRGKAVDKKGKPDNEKYKKLMTAEFRCKKLEGRARYHHNVLRQVWHEVMCGEDPRKKVSDEVFQIHARTPKKRDGCLVLTEEGQRLLDEKPLASQSNNHLVRHRIQVLAGNMQLAKNGGIRRTKAGAIFPRNSLLDDIISEFANGDEKRVARITIEVTRDLQEMSGKDNEAKKQIEGRKRSAHADIANKLAKWLVDENDERMKVNGESVRIGKYIKKAWIAEDLKDSTGWRCPYTVAAGSNNPPAFEPKHLVIPLSDNARLELEHIIPKSKRVANGMEAQVITFRAVNQWKDQRTGLEFIKAFHGQTVPGLPGRRVMEEHEYRAFVNGLSEKGATKQDILRKKKRKELLLTEHWNEQDFTPRDLTNTAYVVKLAAEKLRARFQHLKTDAPPVVYIPGSVTSAFRDKSWKMFRELAAVHPEVKAEIDKGEDRYNLGFDGDKPTERTKTREEIEKFSPELKQFLKDFAKESFTEQEKEIKRKELSTLFENSNRPEMSRKVFWRKSSFNLKKAMREITNLHHAVDAATLGLVTHYLVPPQGGSLDGTLAKYVVKGSLNNTERKDFEQKYYSLQLSKFFDFEQERRLRFKGEGYEEQEGNRTSFISRCGEELRSLIDKDAREPLTADERSRFEKLVEELGLPKLFYFDIKNRLYIRKLHSEIKNQLHVAFGDAMNRRMVQHVPADMGNLDCAETIYRVFDPNDQSPNSQRLHRWFKRLLKAGKRKKLEYLPDPNNPDEKMVLLTTRKHRDSSGGETGETLHDTGKGWRWIYLLKTKEAVHGLNPENKSTGKLQNIKAAQLLGKNFGVAIISAAGEQPSFEIVRPRGVYKFLEKLRLANPEKKITLIKSGSLIRKTTDDGKEALLKIFGCGDRAEGGIYFDVGAPDACVRERTSVPISAFEKGLATVIQRTFTGKERAESYPS